MSRSRSAEAASRSRLASLIRPVVRRFDGTTFHGMLFRRRSFGKSESVNWSFMPIPIFILEPIIIGKTVVHSNLFLLLMSNVQHNFSRKCDFCTMTIVLRVPIGVREKCLIVFYGEKYTRYTIILFFLAGQHGEEKKFISGTDERYGLWHVSIKKPMIDFNFIIIIIIVLICF